MEGISVTRHDGVKGTIIKEQEQGDILIKFNDDSQMIVPRDILILQEDGSYYLLADKSEDTESSENTDSEEIVITVIAEELDIETENIVRQVVRVHKRVETREETVNTTLNHEEVVVERIPFNSLLDETIPKARKENGVLIIPVIEEVLVVEKRLLLKEEVRISKRRTKETTPQKILLRREVVDIERREPDDTELI
jgi:uncharacterized protein (TIGR02271 family)